MEPKERLFVALDDDGGPDFVPGKMEHPLVRKLLDEVGGFKIGSILFDMIGTLAGGDGVKTIGEPIMLDLKWLDTPDTMGRIGERMARNFDCEFCTVHARGGVEAMRAFRDAVLKVAEVQAKRHQVPIGDWMTKILGVTVLTSETYDDLLHQRLVRTPEEAGSREVRPEEMEYFKQLEVERLIVQLTYDAKESGLDGVVVPPRYSTIVRSYFGPDLIIVTPGVRFTDSPPDNHIQPATPSQAIANGADYIVMGRSITKATDPAAAAKRAVKEITEALAKRT